MRYPISGYDVVLDEFLHHCGGNHLVGCCFHPLCEVVDGHQDIAMTIGGSWMNNSDDVYSLSRERPWGRHVVQLLQGSMDKVPMDLAVMASAHELTTIFFY